MYITIKPCTMPCIVYRALHSPPTVVRFLFSIITDASPAHPDETLPGGRTERRVGVESSLSTPLCWNAIRVRKT